MAASRKRRAPDQLVAAVAEVIAGRCPPTERACIALSGGCDSVVLLHVLKSIFDGRLTALHVHHGLSPNADAWAEFCLSLCRTLEIPLAVRRVAVDRESAEGLEAAARRARYAEFSSVDADLLFLAQHRDDQAETLLFNLLRGSGIAGLASMPVERDFAGKRLIRPLLDLSRAEIETYARAHGLLWIEDESNQDQRFARNYLRRSILPILRDRFPAVDRQLANAAAHCAEADELLAELAHADWQALGAGDSLSLDGFRELSTARGRNLIRYRLRQLGWRAPTSERLHEFVRQLHVAGPDRHPALSLPDGVMRVHGRQLHWLRLADEPPR